MISKTRATKEMAKPNESTEKKMNKYLRLKEKYVNLGGGTVGSIAGRPMYRGNQ